MQRIKKGDDVMVIAGRDKGKRGNVLRVIRNQHGVSRALVDNVNLVKRHTKGNPSSGESGGIIEKEAPIHLSNLALYNPASGKGRADWIQDPGRRAQGQVLHLQRRSHRPRLTRP